MGACKGAHLDLQLLGKTCNSAALLARLPQPILCEVQINLWKSKIQHNSPAKKCKCPVHSLCTINPREKQDCLSQGIRILAERSKKKKRQLWSMVWWQCDCFFLFLSRNLPFRFFLVHSEVCTLFFPTRLLPELEEFRWSGCQGSLSARNDKEQFCQSKIYRKKSCLNWKIPITLNNLIEGLYGFLISIQTYIHLRRCITRKPRKHQASSWVHHLESVIVSIVSDRFWASKWEMRNVTKKIASLSRTLLILTLSPLISEAISH